jgi:putative flippase GtrA
MVETSAPSPRFATTRTLVALVSRFGLAGLVNTGIGFTVIAALDVGLHLSPPLANAAGYLVGMGVGFILNRRFVFRSETSARATAPRYIVVVLAAFALNQLILRALGASLGAGALPHSWPAGSGCFDRGRGIRDKQIELSRHRADFRASRMRARPLSRAATLGPSIGAIGGRKPSFPRPSRTSR